MTAAMAQPPRKILLVGEGDFTFALALKLALPEIDLTATGFDALDDVRRTYPVSYTHLTLPTKA